MEAHLRLGDTEFMHQFERTSLDPKVFSHEAHLRLAWIHIKHHGQEEAIAKLITQIKTFASKHGAPDKFNMTVTVAAVKAVHHFVKKSKSASFVDFILEFPRLKHHFKDLMAAHYSFEIFTSPRAKVKYLAPDLLPFD